MVFVLCTLSEILPYVEHLGNLLCRTNTLSYKPLCTLECVCQSSNLISYEELAFLLIALQWSDWNSSLSFNNSQTPSIKPPVIQVGHVLNDNFLLSFCSSRFFTVIYVDYLSIHCVKSRCELPYFKGFPSFAVTGTVNHWNYTLHLKDSVEIKYFS